MTITFTKPVKFKSIAHGWGSTSEYWRTTLSSGLEIVGMINSFPGYMGTTPLVTVHLYEDGHFDQAGQYTKTYGAPHGYPHYGSLEAVLVKLGFVQFQYQSIFNYDDEAPPTIKAKIIPSIRQCACGFRTDYPIECEGQYVCKSCSYWKDCSGTKK